MRFCYEPLEVRTLLSTWYVSASGGSTTNPGTLSQPFLTIQQAANLAQPGDTVLIRGGTYHETVVPAHSGTASQPITYQPYNNEPVTIDGADPVSGWNAYGGSVYQANLAWDLGAGQNQVFVDGQMMNEARWPNTSLDVSHPTFVQTTSATSTVVAKDTITSATIGVPLNDPAGAWVGATIHISPGPGWVMQTGTVTASSPGSLTYTYEQLNAEAPTAGNSFFLTGVFRALNSPAQWYVDNTGKLSLWTPQGDSPAGHNVEVKHRLYGFDLSGDSYINVNGVNLFATSINTSAASGNDTISGISAQYVSNNWINAYPWGIQYAPHTTGIILNGVNNTLRNSTIRYSSGDGVFLGGSGNSVLNCVICDVDYAGGDEAGISTLGANEQVVGNTVYNSGRGGIVVRHTTASGIVHNVIHDVGLQETDLGAIYTWGTDGQGTEIAYNLVYNVYSGGYGAAGVYLDNDSYNYLVDHNVVWNSDFGLKLNPVSGSNRVYNNTFVGTQNSLATSGNADMTGTVFENNIFSGPFQNGTGTTQSNNLFSPTDPLFVDPAGGNFQLRPGSPAIDAGLVIWPYTNGYAGAAPDEGAYESGVAPFTAGSTLPPFPTAAVVPPPTITPGSTTATFLRADATSQGTWTPSYGADGYSLFDSGINWLPGYAQVAASNQQAAGWSYSTTDPRALLSSRTSLNRIASCYFSPSSFTLDVNLTDGAAHRVSIYMVDYDYQNRSQTVQVSDAASGTVLDTRTVSNFSGGQYLSWNLSGHVKITFTNVGGNNTLANAIFFDAPGSVSTPPGPALAAAASPGSVSLNWPASGAANLAGYYVYRSSSAAGPFSQLNPVPVSANSFVDAAAPQGVTVYYEVAAVNTAGVVSVPLAASLLASSVSLAPGFNPAVFGQNVSLSAAVTGAGGVPAGTVTFEDGSIALGTAAVDATGHTVLNISSLAIGPHPITAVYSGSSTFDSSSSAVLVEQIGQAADAVTLSSSSAAATFGQSVTFTAAVASKPPGGGTPTGTVTFSDGSAVLGTASVNSSGQATWVAPLLSVGSHTITAAYSGDANFVASASAAFSQAIRQVGTITTASALPNPSTVGQTVVLTAVVGSGGVPAAGTPSGTVTFLDGLTTLGIAPVDASGRAAFSAAGLSAGSHSITASYSGDVNFAASVSSAALTQVNSAAPAGSTTMVTGPSAQTVYGQPATFTATVAAAAPGPLGPTGSLTFRDGSTILGTVAINASGQATLSTIALSAGLHSITATYGGDANFAGSASAALADTVAPASSTTALSSSSSSAPVGQAITFAATVAAVAPGAGVPTGTVQFAVDGAKFGSPVALVGGVASSAAISSLSLGAHSVTATYSGDTNFLAAPPVTVMQTVVAPVNAATFVKADATSHGTWSGVYGADGYGLFASSSSYPAYSQAAVSGAQSYVWSASTSDPAAPQVSASSNSREAACYYSGTGFTLDINLIDARSHQVALYMTDFDNLNRAQSVQVTDATSGAVLDTQAVSNFQKGQYLVWNLSGHVKITLTRTGPQNAVASALFFDPVAGVRPAAPANFSAAGSASGITLGWAASSDPSVTGYNVFRSVTASGTFTQLNANLLSGVTFTDTSAALGMTSYYQVRSVNALGVSSDPSSASAVRPDLIPPATPAGLVASVVAGGVQLNWSANTEADLSGYNVLRSTSAAGPFVQLNTNLLTATSFTDPAAPVGATSYYQLVAVNSTGVGSAPAPININRPAPATAATFVRLDTVTHGTWTGSYGSDGYNLFAGSSQYPSYAQAGISGAQSYVWNASTSDPAALQSAAGSASRFAGCDYSATNFTIDLNLTDGKTHQVGLYVSDFDNLNRAESVQVTDAVTGAMLDTQIVANFQKGEYLVWNLSGHVKITVTRTGAQNAVAGGLFFDPAS